MTKFNEILPECFRRWPDIFGGDEMISKCAALAQGVEDRSKAYINEPAMHRKQSRFQAKKNQEFQSINTSDFFHHWSGRIRYKWTYYGIVRDGNAYDEYTSFLLSKITFTTMLSMPAEEFLASR